MEATQNPSGSGVGNMAIRILAAVLIVATINTAFAQNELNDPAFLQRALAAVQAQRNAALDAAAVAEARAAGLSAELTRTQARVKELETKKD